MMEKSGEKENYGIGMLGIERKMFCEKQNEERGVKGVMVVSMCAEETYWWSGRIQLLKHNPSAAIRTELPCLPDHPQSSSPRHHQPSLHFYATLPLADLFFFHPYIHCVLHG